MTDRKKPGVAFWATVAMVVVLVGYPLSWGPAWWLSHQSWCPNWTYCAYLDVYRPLRQLRVKGPYPIHEFVSWYADFCWDGRSDSKLDCVPLQ
jgi:hypothetical protein